MNVLNVALYVTGIIATIGFILVGAALTHGIVFGMVGTALLHDPHLVGIIGFVVSGLACLGMSAIIEFRGEIDI